MPKSIDAERIKSLSDEDLCVLCYDQYPHIYDRLRDCNRDQVITWLTDEEWVPLMTDVRSTQSNLDAGKRGIWSMKYMNVKWIGIFVIVIAIAILATLFWVGIDTDSAKYGFEDDTMGWVEEEHEFSQGIITVEQSADQAKFGKHSLKLIAELEGGHLNKSKGEAYVEVEPLSLIGKPIKVWVYIPKGAEGDSEKPNGIQVFVKDQDDKSLYGTWENITSGKVNNWQQIILTPVTSRPKGGHIDPDFDPAKIVRIGVKIGIGEGSGAKYQGPIYIDSVDWP